MRFIVLMLIIKAAPAKCASFATCGGPQSLLLLSGSFVLTLKKIYIYDLFFMTFCNCSHNDDTWSDCMSFMKHVSKHGVSAVQPSSV